MKKILLAIIACFVLVSCATPEPKPQPLLLDFTSLGAIPLNVQRVSVVNRAAVTPSRAPYIGHLFQPSLTDAIYKWSGDRLQANGGNANASLIIREASMTDTPLTLDTGIESWFTRQQAHRYILKIEVALEVRTTDNREMGLATAKAMRSMTLPEDPSETEKDKAYKTLLMGAMEDLNRGFDQSMQEHMGSFLVK